MPIEVPPDTEKPQKPGWIRAKSPGSPDYMETRALVKRLALHTVCEEAHCPNIGECWAQRTATFMIMGDLCSRRCTFCTVKKGSYRPNLANSLPALDREEPLRVALAVKELKLRHAVITSVTRDDLPDGGSSHFARTVELIHQHASQCKVELLIPDFKGSTEALKTVLDSGVDILNHNLETVPRLYKEVRPLADYTQSLELLARVKELSPQTLSKSGIMVGMGETAREVLSLMDDLRWSKVDIMTIGQYLRPTPQQLPVKEFITPDEFKAYEKAGLEKGFLFVESGPLVRSSYHAWKHTSK